VTALPAGLPWAQVFGPGQGPLDRLTAASAVGAAVDVCAALGVLRERGFVHARLHPSALFVDRGQRCFLRDAGLAAMPAPPDEGQAFYLAPEQARAFSAVDARTDVYQLAAVMYHTLTGHAPSPGASPPVRAALPEFPKALDEMLLRSLERDIDRRPADTRVIRDALAEGRRALSQSGAR
jgi:serine/threonine protein kinase